MFARVGIASRLLVLVSALLLAAGFAVDRVATSQLELANVEALRGRLSTELRLLEVAIAATPEAQSDTAWDPLADRLAPLTDARVTLIAGDGSVIGDSELTSESLAHLENHANRPEIAAALKVGEATATRASPSLGVRMLYVARRMNAPVGRLSVVRLAVPLTAADAAIARARTWIFLGTGVVLAFAVAAMAVGAELLTRPIRALTRAAIEMANGHLDRRAPAHGGPEVARLAEALDRLARELSRTIAELRTDRDLLAGILDGMIEGVLVTDEKGVIVLANAALRSMRLVGTDPVGRPVVEAIRNAQLHDLVEDAGLHEQSVTSEIAIDAPSPRKLLVRVSRLSQDDGTSGRIAVLHDVTDLRRLETIRTDFVANVSHELRTPITAIGTAAETLSAGALRDPAEAEEFVGIITRHAERLRRLVDDLLDLSRIEAKTTKLALAPTDPALVVETARGLLREAASRRRVTVAFERMTDALVQADRRALEQVVLNLLDNAIKYAGEGAKVTVRVMADDSSVTVEVDDTGPGIPAAHQSRIFERFYRVDPGRSRDLGGTGLGLSIVRHLVELMSGSVDVASSPGEGATFTVRLPRAPITPSS